MTNRFVIITIITIIFLPALFPSSITEDLEIPSWLEEWSFHKEIEIPINTSNEYTKYQPIDIQINFNNSCWAIDENENSIIVIYNEGDELKELESQIYNLNFSSENYIQSCGLVFLIPEFATGYEKYYVYYDDEPKTSRGYDDHVQIIEGDNHYEPIPGLYYESWYYEIIQDESIVYAISKKGIAVDYPTVQQVAVMKPGATNTLPKNGEYAVDMNFKYWYYTNNKWNPIFCNEYVESEILIDGNLMVKCAIVSKSDDDYFKSTVYYKYYYTPHEDKRLYTNVIHEAVNYPLPRGEKIDFGYATIRYSKTISSIDDLNIDGIPPYLHHYDEEDDIKTYDFDTTPESDKWEPIIGQSDDADLGRYPWVSGDYGETGKASSFIFETNKTINPKFNIRDGINIRLFEKNILSFPIDISFADIYLIGNTYETGEDHEKMLPAGFKLEFNAEIFTTLKGGYKAVQQEAELYQKLVGFQPENKEEINGSENEQNEYTLTAKVCIPQSIKFEILDSRLLLKDVHIMAELYKDGIFKSKQRVGRIKISDDLKIDWKNISLINKVKFEHLNKGNYLIKLFLEDSILGDGKKFIGYKIVDVSENSDINIFCKPEGKIDVSIKNQDSKGVKNSEIRLVKEGIILSSNITDDSGKIIIGAPSGIGETYQLKILYDGFIIIDEQISLSQIRRIIPLKKNINLNLSNFIVSLKNSNGNMPDIKVFLTSDEMNEPVEIYPDIQDEENFKFLYLYPANYTVNIQYNQFQVKEKIKISGNNNLNISLYDFSVKVFDFWNLSFGASLDVKISSIDFKNVVDLKGVKNNHDGYDFLNIYPGNYLLKVSYKSNIVEQNITIPYFNNDQINVSFPITFNVSTKVFDSHGNHLKDANVIFLRNGVNISSVTGDKDVIVFSLPPGNYYTEVYVSDSLVSKRIVDVLNDKDYLIVTNHEPFIFLIVTTLLIISLIGISLYCIKKKQLMLFFELLVVIITLISVVMPWWTINGNSSKYGVETNSTLYLIPGKMVTFTSSNITFAGEFITLNESFDMQLYLLMVVILTGAGLLLLNIILKKFHMNKISNLSYVLGMISIVFSTIGFYYGVSIFSDILTGTCTKQGSLEVAVPGESIYYTVSCSYGPNIGFYMILISSILVVIMSFFKIKRFFKNKRDNLKY